MLAAMLQGAKIPDFGVRLTPDMLPDYLATQRAAATAWRRDHPDDARRAAEAAANADALEAARGKTR
jgi:hypothetical protein